MCLCRGRLSLFFLAEQTLAVCEVRWGMSPVCVLFCPFRHTHTWISTFSESLLKYTCLPLVSVFAVENRSALIIVDV